MTLSRNEQSKELIGRLVKECLTQFPDQNSKGLEQFIRQYYQRVGYQDLLRLTVENLKGAVISHWQLLQQRTTGETCVRTYNPQFEKHAWQSTHTVMEIVTDDLPFLIDSVSMALNRHGLTIHLTIHPVLQIIRNKQGQLVRLLASEEKVSCSESIMHFEVDRQTGAKVLEGLEEDVLNVVRDVRKASQDWQAMRQQLLTISQDLDSVNSPVSTADREECKAFLQWIEADHFTLLGYCQHQVSGCKDGQYNYQYKKDSGLGILRGEQEGTPLAGILPTHSSAYQRDTMPLIVTKADALSTIHRPVFMDFISIKFFDDKKHVQGEHCFVGLFSSAAYNRATRDIPLLRHKVERVIKNCGFLPNSHDSKALQNVIEVFPRDDLFQIGDGPLLDTVMGILELQERQRIRVFANRDRFGRFFSCLVYVPRERYNRDLRLKVQAVLMDTLCGQTVEFEARFSESVLARVHYIIRVIPGTEPKLEPLEIEQRVVEAAYTWSDQLQDAMIEMYGEEKGNHYISVYGNAFRGDYREDYPARTAGFDIEIMEKVYADGQLGIHFYRPVLESKAQYRLKLYAVGQPIALTNILPVIENMGLKVMGERPHKIKAADRQRLWIHDFTMTTTFTDTLEFDAIEELFQDALAHIWNGTAENDGFNQLVLGAGLSWRETAVFRTYAEYLRQIRSNFSMTYMARTLVRNPGMASNLMALYHLRLDPAKQRQDSGDPGRVLEQINTLLDEVANLDEDRILRRFLNLIQCTTRTSFYLQSADGQKKPYLSMKLDPTRIVKMPDPRPMYEIVVSSPRFAAVHLRGGPVARGGIRWSDRPEDFRTEILGLVKAQRVKNAVIVPVGSKGGFVPKQLPVGGDREALMNEVIYCYKNFMRGMLDLTDNLEAGKVIPPQSLVRHDGDDPYFVVAADKGTATFSDIANSVADEYGYWLSDAFASGGSAGYDHKKMGITARGAWESVKRHFREIGTNIQTTDFTVVGIGDMSGDVFGNGMLLSKHIRLLGAFNHLHIFLDPNPDLKKSFAERQRLFALPRSSWCDYSSKLLSKGGGIYERTAKFIDLSPEIREALQLTEERMTPTDLIHAMLLAPVDLLWNGGIGTYIKSAQESHAQASDRANDGLRADGGELHCKVLGEGGNLGVTQLGRIEYAAAGGLCYSDSIDNSAGVDCSDHEVNIKILLNQIVANGDMTIKQRNELLVEMTDDVAQLVLRDNYEQTQSISIMASQSAAMLDEHQRYLSDLEHRGLLDRQIEFMPDDKELYRRKAQNRGLTLPELSILCSYSKMTTFDELLQSDLTDDPALNNELVEYFPPLLRKRYAEQMPSHRLHREIIATRVVNSMVNRMGPSFAFRLQELTGSCPADIACAYMASREIVGLKAVTREVEAFDNTIPTRVQYQLFSMLNGLVERCSLWLLQNRRGNLDISETINAFQPGMQALWKAIPKPLSTQHKTLQKQRISKFCNAGVDKGLAEKVAAVIPMSQAMDITEVTVTTGAAPLVVASVYYYLGAHFDLLWLRDRISELPDDSYWHLLARNALRHSLNMQQRQLACEVLSYQPGKTTRQTVENWIGSVPTAHQRFRKLMKALHSGATVDFAMLSVALNELNILVGSSPAV